MRIAALIIGFAGLGVGVIAWNFFRACNTVKNSKEMAGLGGY